jgi:hypothetical protein
LRQDKIAIAKVDVAIIDVAKVEILKLDVFDCLEITIIRRRRTIELESNCVKCVSIAKFPSIKKEKFASIVVVDASLALFGRR